MKESEIDWNNVEVLDAYTFYGLVDQYSLNFNLSFEVYKYSNVYDETYYQLNASLPFSFKSTWLKTPKNSLEEWIKYTLERLDSVLKDKYKSIRMRDYLQQKEFESFKSKIQFDIPKSDKDLNILYATKLNHESLYEKIGNKTIGTLQKELYEENKNNKTITYTHVKDDRDIIFHLTWNKFLNIALVDSCGYCGVTIKEINNMDLYTKRARGYSMEVDQINAYGFYSDANCIASCYWCNNAKTDEFSFEEFKKIATNITTIWNDRK